MSSSQGLFGSFTASRILSRTIRSWSHTQIFVFTKSRTGDCCKNCRKIRPTSKTSECLKTLFSVTQTCNFWRTNDDWTSSLVGAPYFVHENHKNAVLSEHGALMTIQVDVQRPPPPIDEANLPALQMASLACQRQNPASNFQFKGAMVKPSIPYNWWRILAANLNDKFPEICECSPPLSTTSKIELIVVMGGYPSHLFGLKTRDDEILLCIDSNSRPIPRESTRLQKLRTRVWVCMGPFSMPPCHPSTDPTVQHDPDVLPGCGSKPWAVQQLITQNNDKTCHLLRPFCILAHALPNVGPSPSPS